MEPTTGIEPVTHGLRNRRTSTNPSTIRQTDRLVAVEAIQTRQTYTPGSTKLSKQTAYSYSAGGA